MPRPIGTKIPGFAARLKKLIESRGGVDEVAHNGYPHLKPYAIRNWISGIQEPSLSKLPALARTLGVSVDYLIFGEQEQERQSA
jgi:transcriptional regulator with XRE-family HTH domain